VDIGRTFVTAVIIFGNGTRLLKIHFCFKKFLAAVTIENDNYSIQDAGYFLFKFGASRTDGIIQVFIETNSSLVNFYGGQVIQPTNAEVMVSGQWLISDNVNYVDWFILASGTANAALNVSVPEMYEFCSSELTCNCKLC
jgi:hypothetical protein